MIILCITNAGDIGNHTRSFPTIQHTNRLVSKVITSGAGFTNVATSAATRPVGIFDTSTTGAGVAIVNLKPATTAPAA